MSDKILKPRPPATFFAAPFGPYNRFLDSLSNLYVESGAVSLSYTSYAKLDSYFPEQLYTNKEWCPITGYLRMGVTETKDENDCDVPKASSVMGGNPVTTKSGFSESIVFGCEKKLDKVECSDPRGNVLTFARHVQNPKIFITPPMLPPAMGAAGGIDAYVTWVKAFGASLGTTAGIIKLDKVSSPFAATSGGDICGCDLINKKNFTKRLPSQSFSGKTDYLFNLNMVLK